MKIRRILLRFACFLVANAGLDVWIGHEFPESIAATVAFFVGVLLGAAAVALP